MGKNLINSYLEFSQEVETIIGLPAWKFMGLLGIDGELKFGGGDRHSISTSFNTIIPQHGPFYVGYAKNRGTTEHLHNDQLRADLLSALRDRMSIMWNDFAISAPPVDAPVPPPVESPGDYSVHISRVRAFSDQVGAFLGMTPVVFGRYFAPLKWHEFVINVDFVDVGGYPITVYVVSTPDLSDPGPLSPSLLPESRHERFFTILSTACEYGLDRLHEQYVERIISSSPKLYDDDAPDVSYEVAPNIPEVDVPDIDPFFAQVYCAVLGGMLRRDDYLDKAVKGLLDRAKEITVMAIGSLTTKSSDHGQV